MGPPPCGAAQLEADVRVWKELAKLGSTAVQILASGSPGIFAQSQHRPIDGSFVTHASARFDKALTGTTPHSQIFSTCRSLIAFSSLLTSPSSILFTISTLGAAWLAMIY